MHTSHIISIFWPSQNNINQNDNLTAFAHLLLVKLVVKAILDLIIVSKTFLDFVRVSKAILDLVVVCKVVLGMIVMP